MKKVTVRESIKGAVELSLKNKDIDTDILWDTAYMCGSSHTYVKVKCNICGNSKDFQVVNLSTGKYKCNHCVLRKYSNYCNNLNLKLIDKLYENKRLKILVECRICGEQCTTQPSPIKSGEFRCNGCNINKYKDCLTKKKCSFISIERNKGSKSIIHYQNIDGDKFKASTGHVIEGKFEVSLNGYWSHPHSVYLIKLQVEGGLFIYKIGTANDPSKRAKSLKLNKNYEVFILDSFEDRFAADKLESELHSEFSNFRLKPEQASVHTDSNVLRKNKTGKYHRVKDGITEWFSSEVYETLKVRYNLT